MFQIWFPDYFSMSIFSASELESSLISFAASSARFTAMGIPANALARAVVTMFLHPSRHLLFLEDEAEVESDSEKPISANSSPDVKDIEIEN